MSPLTEMEKSAISEVGNISMGSSATALSTLINQNVNITTPQVSYGTLEEIKNNYPIPSVVVEVEYIEGLAGNNVLIVKERDATIIANLMMGQDPETEVEELDEVQISAVSEAMNQMMGSSSTAMAELFDMQINISHPVTKYINLQNLEKSDSELGETLVTITFKIEIGDLINSELLLLIPESFAKDAAAKLLQKFEMPGEEAEADSEADVETKADTEGQQEKTEEDLSTGEDETSGEASVEEIQENLVNEAAAEEVPVEDVTVEEEEGKKLTDDEIDALSEIGNISMGSAATALSNLLNKRVSITTPTFMLTDPETVKSNYPIPCVIVNVQYLKGFSGQNMLVIKEEDAIIIAGIMMGEDLNQLKEGLDEIQLSAVSESMNQMMGSASTSMADLFNFTVDISPPQSVYRHLGEDEEEFDISCLDDDLIQISFQMEIGNLINSEIIQLMPVEFGKKLAAQLLQSLSPTEEIEETGEDISSQSVEAFQEVEKGLPGEVPGEETDVQEEKPAQSFLDTIKGDYNIDLIRDLPVTVSGLFGKTTMKMKDVLEFDQGTVVELDKLVGEPVDILANGKLVARGEIVVIEEEFGIKIVEIIKTESDADLNLI